MALRYYGFNRGQTEFSVTEGAATGGTDAEFRFDETKGFTNAELQVILDQIKNVIIKNQSGYAPS